MCHRDSIIVAMRGREPSGGVYKHSYILHPVRTEYGKAIRKKYENHAVTEKRANMQRLEPRTDGLSNTITTVQKDNLVLEIYET